MNYEIGQLIFESISKHRSSIMGIAVLSIMQYHWISAFGISNPGFLGVDVFLFLSGIGMVKSLGDNTMKIYFMHRFKRLFPTCFFCGLIKYTLFAIGLFSIPISAWTLTGLDLWYIRTILIFYVISPCLVRLCKSLRLFPISCFLLCILFAVFFRENGDKDTIEKTLFGVLAWSIERFPVFLFGMIFAMNYQHFTNKELYLSALFLFLSFVIKGIDKMQILSLDHILFLPLFALGLPALLYAILLILEKTYRGVYNILSHLGKISLELYLVHEYIFQNFLSLEHNKSSFIMFILACLLSYSLAMLSHWITKSIQILKR